VSNTVIYHTFYIQFIYQRNHKDLATYLKKLNKQLLNVQIFVFFVTFLLNILHFLLLYKKDNPVFVDFFVCIFFIFFGLLLFI